MPSTWFAKQKARPNFDASYQESRTEKRGFDRIRRAEYQYGVRLRKLARHVGDIVRHFPQGSLEASAEITKVLKAYSIAIQPWAKAVANSMLVEVNRRDEIAWTERTKDMAASLRLELKAAPTGVLLRQMQEEQLKYITKIPLDAATRVHELTMEGILGARRAEDIAQEIRRTTQVSESYANLVARTEVGRVATNLTAARATHIGSEGYIWRTAGDSDVRKTHRDLEGTYHRWDRPPLCDLPNYHSHPGAIFNCRCYPEVVIPEQYR